MPLPPTPPIGCTITPATLGWVFMEKGWDIGIPERPAKALGRHWLRVGIDSQSPGGEAVSLSTRESTPTPASQGGFPLAPPAHCFPLRILTLQPDPARPVGDSSGPNTEWPSRHCPLVAIVCNYNLQTHNEISILTCWDLAPCISRP